MMIPARNGCGAKMGAIMAKIVQFPRINHGRAPFRAASRVMISAVKPAICATSVARMADHHSGGMLSRWGHLRAVAIDAPISAAITAGDGQSATTSRNVEIERIEFFLGQLVLKSKPMLSHDCRNVDDQNVPMGEKDEDPAVSAFRDAFAARVKFAREERDLTQIEIAEILEIDQGTYKQYETRSFLPHYLVRKFCLVCGVEPGWLFSHEVAVPKRQPRTRRRGTKRKKPTAA